MSQKAVQELLDLDDPVGSLLQVVLKYEAIPEQAPQPHDTPRARDREKPVAPGAIFLPSTVGAHGRVRSARPGQPADRPADGDQR